MGFRDGVSVAILAISLDLVTITSSNAAEAVRTASDLKLQEDALHQLDIRDSRGVRLDLDHHDGKVLIVNFWASWCPPCLQELPALEKMKRDVGEKVEIALVSAQDDWPKDRQFAQIHHLNFPLYVYSPAELHVEATALSAKIRGPTTLQIPLPITAMFVPNGRLVDALTGPKKWDSPIIEQDLRDLSQAH